MQKDRQSIFDIPTALNALAVGFWLWLAYQQIMTAIREMTIVPLLLGLESGVVGYFLLSRKPESGSNPQPWYIRLFILVTAMIGPVFVEVGEGAASWWVVVLSSAGLALTIWALVTLGKSFSVAPADRGLVTGGPYRFVRHPMYTGALLNLGVVVLANLTPINIVVLVTVIGMNIYRILLEERIVTGYSDYAVQVRWRMIPFVW